MTNPIVVPVPDACKALSIGRTTLYELIKAGRLKVVKLGRSTRITAASIQALANEGTAFNADQVEGGERP